MNSQQISKIIKINGKSVTDRTIRRWFSLLKGDRKFNYFLNVNPLYLGLNSMWVLVTNVYNSKIFDIIPYRTYIAKGVFLNELKKSFLLQFYIPTNKIKQFKHFWREAKKKKMLDNYFIYKVKPSISIYQPFHRVLDMTGQFKKFVDVDDFFLKLFEKSMTKKYKAGIHPIILKNPI